MMPPILFTKARGSREAVDEWGFRDDKEEEEEEAAAGCVDKKEEAANEDNTGGCSAGLIRQKDF